MLRERGQLFNRFAQAAKNISGRSFHAPESFTAASRAISQEADEVYKLVLLKMPLEAREFSQTVRGRWLLIRSDPDR